MANDFHYTPYPYPPKKVLLLFMGLPPTATEAEYRDAWEKKLKPLKDKTLSQVFADKVAEIQRERNLSFDDAWTVAKMRNKALVAAMNAETQARRAQGMKRGQSYGA